MEQLRLVGTRPWQGFWQGDVPKQIWGGFDGFEVYEIRQGTTAIGKLVVAGPNPPNNAPANEDAWFWTGTAWPDSFDLVYLPNGTLPSGTPDVVARVEFQSTSATHSTSLPHKRWTCTRVRAGQSTHVATLSRWGSGAQLWVAHVSGTSIVLDDDDILAFRVVDAATSVVGKLGV